MEWRWRTAPTRAQEDATCLHMCRLHQATRTLLFVVLLCSSRAPALLSSSSVSESTNTLLNALTFLCLAAFRASSAGDGESDGESTASAVPCVLVDA